MTIHRCARDGGIGRVPEAEHIQPHVERQRCVWCGPWREGAWTEVRDGDESSGHVLQLGSSVELWSLSMRGRVRSPSGRGSSYLKSGRGRGLDSDCECMQTLAWLSKSWSVSPPVSHACGLASALATRCADLTPTHQLRPRTEQSRCFISLLSRTTYTHLFALAL